MIGVSSCRAIRAPLPPRRSALRSSERARQASLQVARRMLHRSAYLRGQSKSDGEPAQARMSTAEDEFHGLACFFALLPRKPRATHPVSNPRISRMKGKDAAPKTVPIAVNVRLLETSLA
jgi:hypothetical protein